MATKSKDEEKSTSWKELKSGVKLQPGHRTILVVDIAKAPAKKPATKR